VKVKDGLIAGIAVLSGPASQANLSAAAALKFGLKNVLDYGDLIISPGLIDTHVHFNEPGREHWEGQPHRISPTFKPQKPPLTPPEARATYTFSHQPSSNIIAALVVILSVMNRQLDNCSLATVLMADF